ncbi:MAG: lipocalin family protein [Bacteriovoracaceae bacterium]
MKLLSKLKSFALCSLLMGCSHSFERTVAHVDRDRFMGPWHVIAGRFTFLEVDPYNSVESYQWDEKEQKIVVDFHYNKGAFDGPIKKVPQTAWITNTETNSTWTVSPFWPLRFTYLIIGLGEEGEKYEWTAIGVPSQNYLWIMARDPQFSKEKTQKVIQYLDSIGYSTKDLVYVKHNTKAIQSTNGTDAPRE